MVQFRIFPNPVSNELILEGNLKGINPSELQIVNAKGELVEVKTERKGNNQFIINMVSLPPGIYAVMVAGHRLNCTPIVKH
jgi:hypothetical protein